MSERRYNKWAGNPEGTSEDPLRCIAQVSDWMLFFQCARKRGHGPGGEFCKQHAKMVEAGRHVYVPGAK